MRQAHVLLLVTGGIAAYKSCYLTRLLTQAGFSVRVALTDAAQRFVAPLTFEVLSEHPVATDLWGEGGGEAMDHIAWAQWADLVVVAPATANLLAKAAAGIADDLVTTLLLAYPGRLILAPAMNDQMWLHPATQKNLASLLERGAVLCEPGSGSLACGTVAEGRLAEPEQILAVIQQEASALAAGPATTEEVPGRSESAAAWAGRKIVITAGPTWEPIDPVRFLANRSTGVLGYALAAEAVQRGAEVTLISGPTCLNPPAHLSSLRIVETAAEMAAEVASALQAGADWLFMAAAVADYRPARRETGKIKKDSLGTSWQLEMTRTIDILAETVRAERLAQLRVVGFALETERMLDRAREKLKAKDMDFIIANDPTLRDSAFGDGRHKVTLIGPEEVLWTSESMPKRDLAREIFARLAGHASSGRNRDG